MYSVALSIGYRCMGYVVYQVYLYAFFGIACCVWNVCLVMYIVYVYELCGVEHQMQEYVLYCVLQ